MEIPDISNPWWFLLVMLVFFTIITGRYFVVSGLFYVFFYMWFPSRWKARKLGKRAYSREQLKKEIGWSMLTAISFSIAGTVTCVLWQHGYTRIYTGIHDYPIWWMPVSLGISLMIDETYYYWIHRWLHKPSVFKRIHKIHHQSNVTSPWTAFAFHPVEGMMLSVVMPVTLMIIPVHAAVILVQLSVMTLSSAVNHLDIEIYPRGFHQHPLGRWMIGATHHSLHHKQFRYNYGLYFTFWDKWKNTESPSFNEAFESATVKIERPEVDRLDDVHPAIDRVTQ